LIVNDLRNKKNFNLFSKTLDSRTKILILYTMTITELDLLHRDHVNAYQAALRDGDRSAVEFHDRQLSKLDAQIIVASRDIDLYDKD